MPRFATIEEPGPSVPPPQQFALWRLGFRPFYLLASAFGALSIALWAAQYAGWLPFAYLQGPLWHAHEMLFGYTLAVVVGFLFTAGSNWSGRPTPTGAALGALALLWLAGRVLVLTPFGWAAAAANAVFPLAAAVGFGLPIVAARSKRNYFFIALLALMGVAVLLVHLAQLGVVRLPGWLGIQVALDVVLFIMAVMGGRVIPMFTKNGVPGTDPRRVPQLEQLALGTTLLVLLADLLAAPAPVVAVATALCAAAHAARLALWQPWRTLRTPLVWVLHAAYLWIPLHLALRAAAAPGWLPASLAVHALTVGAIGGLTIGMMTRTARGHTGRPLRADRYDVACYALVLAAAVTRVLLPLAAPAAYGAAVVGSGALWSAGFALYALRYWPVLTRPRLDGKPG